ncbi:MAG TPA: hypothetical protein VLT33_31065 [Labilithrix sp.]|nr:hypothetical protein [Labilithrix sp.]
MKSDPAAPAATGPADPGATPPGATPPTAPVDEPPWKETKPLVSDVRAISCPSDSEVHVATSTGLYRLEGGAWKTVAAGDFYAVSMTTATAGFAGGEGVFLQRSGSEWSALAAASWKVRAIYTNADGAFVGGTGYMYIGKNQLPVEPLVWFVANDLTLRDEYAFGSRLTAGAVKSIAGSGAYAVASTGSYLQTWSGVAWEDAPSDYFLSGGYRSVAMISGYAFATNGRQIAEPQGTQYDPVGQSPDIAALFTYKTNLLAVGAGGAVLRRSPKGDYTGDDVGQAVDLTAGCATSTGNLWVAGGKRVFRRRDALQ